MARRWARMVGKSTRMISIFRDAHSIFLTRFELDPGGPCWSFRRRSKIVWVYLHTREVCSGVAGPPVLCSGGGNVELHASGRASSYGATPIEPPNRGRSAAYAMTILRWKSGSTSSPLTSSALRFEERRIDIGFGRLDVGEIPGLVHEKLIDEPLRNQQDGEQPRTAQCN